jgi:C4-type Zn-finger protein
VARVRFLCPKCFQELAEISKVTGERLIPDLACVIESTTCDRCGNETKEVIIICST